MATNTDSLVEKAVMIYKSLMQGNGFVNDQKRKEFNTFQKRSQGYQFQAQANPTNVPGIELSGSAKMLLGIKFKNTQAGDVFSLSVNEEIIYLENNAQNFDAGSGATNFSAEFFESLRFLTGKDTIKLTYKGAGGQLVEVDFFYI